LGRKDRHLEAAVIVSPLDVPVAGSLAILEQECGIIAGAALVPTSPAGAAVQLRLLRQWGQDFEWNEPLEELADKLLTGLERIGQRA
jgi:hypothetical protein